MLDDVVRKLAWDAGVVPSSIRRAAFDPHEIIAIVCGPEIMMRCTIPGARSGGAAKSRSTFQWSGT